MERDQLSNMYGQQQLTLVESLEKNSSVCVANGIIMLFAAILQ
jgi:hypothetical protein